MANLFSTGARKTISILHGENKRGENENHPQDTYRPNELDRLIQEPQELHNGHRSVTFQQAFLFASEVEIKIEYPSVNTYYVL